MQGYDIILSKAPERMPIANIHQDFCTAVGKDVRRSEFAVGSVVCENVTAGFCFDLIEVMKEVWGDAVEFAFVQTKSEEPPTNPKLAAMQRWHKNREASLTTSYEERIASLERQVKELRDKYREDTQKLQRRLHAKHSADVRIHPDDPDVYIIRPTALCENIGDGLSKDVLKIVFEVPKDHTFVPVKELQRQLLRATRTNTRGATRGSIRVINALDRMIQIVGMKERELYRNHKRRVRVAKSNAFNW